MIRAGLYSEVPVTRTVAGKRETIIRQKPLFPLNMLRHLAASLFIASGMKPKRVQTRMGHESIQTTFNIYGHLFALYDSDDDEVASIERDLLA